VFFAVGFTLALAATFVVLTWALFTPRISPEKAGNEAASDSSDLAPSPTIGGPELGFEITFPDRPHASRDRYSYESETIELSFQVVNVPRYGAYATGSTALHMHGLREFGFDERVVAEAPGVPRQHWHPPPSRLRSQA
jgi:hypothetical protein